MKLLFITNIPTPYRMDFFNALGQDCQLSVLYEAQSAPGVRFDFGERRAEHYTELYLNRGEINERKVNLKIFPMLAREKYDVILSTSYGYLTEMAALLWMRMRRAPYWLELDGAAIRARESAPRRWIKRLIISGAKGIFSSGLGTDEAMMYYGAEKENIFRYPFTSLDEADILQRPPDGGQKRMLREKLGITESRMIIAVGRFIPVKGMDTVLEAAKQMGGDCGFYLIGGEPSKEYLNITGHDARIHYLDFMSKEELYAYYRAADVLAFPTRGDMWGLVVNEAMANGLPVVTTFDCVAGKELIQDGVNGLLIHKDDPAGLAEGIQTLLRNPELYRTIVCNALDTVSGYTIQRMVKTHMEVLNREMRIR